MNNFKEFFRHIFEKPASSCFDFLANHCVQGKRTAKRSKIHSRNLSLQAVLTLTTWKHRDFLTQILTQILQIFVDFIEFVGQKFVDKSTKSFCRQIDKDKRQMHTLLCT